MKAKELVETLQKLIQEYGEDVPVTTVESHEYWGTV